MINKIIMKNLNQKGSVATIFLVFTALIVFFGAAAAFGYKLWGHLLLDFPAYPIAKAYITHHPKIKDLIGEIQEWDPSPSGDFRYNDQENGWGEMTLHLKGAQGKGVVHLIFDRPLGLTWSVETATLEKEGFVGKVELDSAEQWRKFASTFLKQRKMTEAQGMCQLIQDALPGDDRSVYCFADVALQQGDRQKYLELRQSLANLKPNFAPYISQLGYAYDVYGDNQKSIEFYQKAWDLQKRSMDASALGYLYLNRGELDKAFEWLEKAREGGDKSADLAYRYGRYYYMKKDYQRAIEYFNTANQRNPQDSFPFFGLAYCYRALNQKDSAIFNFEQGISVDPANVLFHRKDLIDYLVFLNYYDEAVYHLLRAILYHSQDIELCVRLARVYELEGRSGEAHKAFDIAQKINVSEASYQKALIDQKYK